MRTAERPVGRAGFTLVELMVALLIGMIVMGVLFQMISGQTRIAAVQSGREEAQQNARGALEIVSSELRSAIPAGLIDAQAQSLTFMQPRAWGVLCEPAAGLTFSVVFPNTGGAGGWEAARANGVVVQDAAGTWLPNPDSYPQRARIAASQVLGAPTAMNCPQLTPAGDVVVVRFTVSNAIGGGAAGDLVATYSLTRYDLGEAMGATWLRRSNGMTDGDEFQQQPLAGPLRVDRFLFTYLDGAGASLGNPGTTAATLRNVRRIGVQVVTESTQQVNGIAQRDSGTAVVTLRN
jgi:prepilin-type N-terminal cleavage/methylation domain-containing protein